MLCYKQLNDLDKSHKVIATEWPISSMMAQKSLRIASIEDHINISQNQRTQSTYLLK